MSPASPPTAARARPTPGGPTRRRAPAGGRRRRPRRGPPPPFAVEPGAPRFVAPAIAQEPYPRAPPGRGDGGDQLARRVGGCVGARGAPFVGRSFELLAAGVLTARVEGAHPRGVVLGQRLRRGPRGDAMAQRLEQEAARRTTAAPERSAVASAVGDDGVLGATRRAAGWGSAHHRSPPRARYRRDHCDEDGHGDHSSTRRICRLCPHAAACPGDTPGQSRHLSPQRSPCTPSSAEGPCARQPPGGAKARPRASDEAVTWMAAGSRTQAIRSSAWRRSSTNCSPSAWARPR